MYLERDEDKLNLKRHLADALSFANLVCGVLSIVAASRGRLDVSLVCLLFGALFDGLDGMAARKYGGTRLGVYADDIADGVNYGLAPGAALYFTFAGVEGALLGGLFAAFTICRLTYFTLNKSNGDPEYFSGVPSTTGGILVLTTLLLFPQYPALSGFLVGVACTLMVTFDTLYRHLGRYLSSHQSLLSVVPFYLLLLLSGSLYFGLKNLVAVIFAANLIYGFLPVVKHFQKALEGKSKE